MTGDFWYIWRGTDYLRTSDETGSKIKFWSVEANATAASTDGDRVQRFDDYKVGSIHQDTHYLMDDDIADFLLERVNGFVDRGFYFVFAGSRLEIPKGWVGFRGEFATLAAAQEYVTTYLNSNSGHWYQIIKKKASRYVIFANN